MFWYLILDKINFYLLKLMCNPLIISRLFYNYLIINSYIVMGIMIVVKVANMSPTI